MSWKSFFENPLPWPSKERGSPLCHLCSSLVRRFSLVRKRPWAYEQSKDLEDRTIEDLEHFARRGCHFCHLLIRSLSDEDCKKIRKHIYTTLELRSYYNTQRESRQLKKFFVYVYYGRQENGSHVNSISKMFQVADPTWLEGQPHDFRGFMRAYEKTNHNDKCFALIRQWIKTCEETHTMCRHESVRHPRHEQSLHPGRVLHVGNIDSPRLHLCDGARLGLDEKYVTLSHRWGTNAPLRLTRSCLESFMDVIPFESLPKTFQDAVIIARELRIQFLWIDSLCIIQDSPEDWQYESMKMAAIYENAWCNIAATKANNSQDGCFATREPADVLPCIWNLNTGDPNRLQDPLSLVHPESLWNEGVEAFELFRRGWVVQERLLAPRILHYSQHQVFWECLTLRACETFPQGVQAPDLQPHEIVNPIKFTRQPNLLGFLGHHAPENHKIWTELVEYYSRCKLSFPDNDKLVAISGIARRLGPAEDYLAGLWLDCLPQQLMWKPEDNQWTVEERPDLEFVRPSQYRVPSWSWAACDGPLKFDIDPSYTPTINIIATNVVPVVNGETFGQLSGGYIQLEGTMEKVRMQTRPFDDGQVLKKQGVHWDTVYLLYLYDGAFLILQPTRKPPGQYVRRGCCGATSYVGTRFTSPLEEYEYEAYLGVQESTGLHRYRITII